MWLTEQFEIEAPAIQTAVEVINPEVGKIRMVF